ncbi:hypothetical protein SASPL_134431 [Salvia splendens]|uniref:Hcy-binding domain-containing protein n=1 Tax=Salvia splendens TaxID=180675 RepID=A0A8X8X6W4_SALSN|nr:hypothetical protein SASPL_134431 [Salvia splendens]
MPSKCFDDDKFEVFTTRWRDAGASLISGCCRTSPCTVRAISKGVRFPLRNTENLGNLVTPPRSVAGSDSLELGNQITAQRFSAEQTKEAFDVARNSIELLNSVLSSSPPKDILQVLLLISLSQSNVLLLVVGRSLSSSL